MGSQTDFEDQAMMTRYKPKSEQISLDQISFNLYKSSLIFGVMKTIDRKESTSQTSESSHVKLANT